MVRTLVLLRGLTRGCNHWADFPKQLNQAFPDTKLALIDLAGNGIRTDDSSPLTIKAALQDIRDQIKQQGITFPIDILALSLGGMITLQWLNDFPEEINKAIVINTSHAGLSKTSDRMKPLTISKLSIGALLPASMREKIIYSVTSNNPVKQLIRNQWIEEAKKRPVYRLNFIRQVFIARSFKTHLRINKEQLLLLASSSDRLVNVASSKALAENTSARLEVHITAGHEITLDDPRWVIHHLTSFLDHS
ncbi:MAG: alpha/beta hydrolase [Oleispira sp.]|nr:alpha/beta hydrolase [Oleispira sp.]MBL4882185.1 alpha/beta hydrolase [Oleispira sp.]